MNKTAISLALLLALCLVAPLQAQPAAAPAFMAPAVCTAVAQPAADSIDLAQIVAPSPICEQCPLELGENCEFQGQSCSWRPGCTCRANLTCCR
jgi:hypothetical protein